MTQEQYQAHMATIEQAAQRMYRERMEEERIERWVERQVDRLDHIFMNQE
jgi:hypothetical protein